jgi:AmmeMemoRadiSam system protein B
MEFRSDVRPSPIAGTWYLGDPVKLARQIDSFLDAVRLSDDDLKGRVIGLVAPHAGHRYSGRTAAYSFKTVQGRPRKLAVILSPFHHYFPGDLLTTAHSAYQTPLGNIPIAKNELIALERLLTKQGLTLTQIPEDEEHSLEIQLPFLQRAWKTDFELLPLMVRSQESQSLKLLAESLYQVIMGKDFLLVASSDLSHFFPLEIAEAMDAEMLRRIQSFDPLSILSAEADGSASACGAGAVATMLWASRLAGADDVQILNYSTSADATGDPSSVVGYGSAAVLNANFQK